MGMLDALAASLGIAGSEAVAQPGGAVAVSGQARAARPILQLNRFPVTLDAGTYKDALSGRNPGGDRRSLFAFRQLVDPVPTYTRSYSPAGSTEQIYELLLNGASVDGESEFAAGVLSEAKRRFASETFANLDGNPGVWRPVYAVPEDWSAAGPERFQRIEIDLDMLDGPASAFAMIGGEDSLELRLGADQAPGAGSGSAGTRLHSIQMEYLLVGLRRPWFHPTLFETNDWFLSGQDAGFCSSGNLNGNNGVLPLIPTGLLLGRSVNVSADWSAADASLLDNAKSAGKPVFLGPFPVSAPGNANSALQVIGWISDLVPFSPKITKKSAGSILVDNRGAYLTRFAVEWNEGAERRSQPSGSFPVLAAKEIGIPLNASKIVVKIEIMTFPWPAETWKTIAALPFDKPVVKKYTLSGTTFDPILKEA